MKKFFEKAKNCFVTTKRHIVSVCAVAVFAATSAMPAKAVTINENATTETVVGGILDVIFNIAFWIGVVITVIGVFSFLLSFKDDNAESQSRGIRLAIVGGSLIGLKLLIKMTGLIS